MIDWCNVETSVKCSSAVNLEITLAVASNDELTPNSLTLF